ncbi:hypothetical protein NK983_34430, partial [Salmonella enterica subsp. enterica serovar Typhimurium]|nr:hypothetical protein [Salmonella enterica subsp. enterica serovar Typhimurium]
MSTIGYIEKYYDQLQAGKAGTPLANIRKGAFADLNKMGIPGSRHEEWKYTRIGSLFNREYQLASV